MKETLLYDPGETLERVTHRICDLSVEGGTRSSLKVSCNSNNFIILLRPTVLPYGNQQCSYRRPGWITSDNMVLGMMDKFMEAPVVLLSV